MKATLKWTILVASGLAGIALWAYHRRKEALGEYIPGGHASGRLPRDFDPEQLRMGVKVEMEHTRDRRIAQEIAMDHLVEDPQYYTKLVAAGL